MYEVENKQTYNKHLQNMNKLRIARETATSLKLDEGKEDIIRPSVPIFAVKKQQTQNLHSSYQH